jgi:RNA polymerase sigma factor (sigma-70 family)
MELALNLFGRELVLGEKDNMLDRLSQLIVLRPARAGEEALFALAQTAPNFTEPFAAVDWCLEHRLKGYSLIYHLNYLVYCGKFPGDLAMGVQLIAGAYDYALGNRDLVLSEIHRVIKAAPHGEYPAPFLISKTIHASQSLKQQDGKQTIGISYVYLIVIATFRLNWEELIGEVSRKKVNIKEVIDKIAGQVKKNPEEAIELAIELADRRNQIISGIEAKRRGPRQLLDPAELSLLIDLVKSGDRQAQDHLVYFFEPALERVANRYARRGVEFDDLMQVARLKLLLLAQRFDPNRGAKFTTYYLGSIDWSLFNETERETGAIHKPANFIAELAKINSLERALSKDLGRSPTKAELAEALEISVEELGVKLQLAMATRSLSDPIGVDDDRELVERIEDHGVRVDHPTLAADLQSILAVAINCSGLKQNEKQVLRLMYLEGQDRTLQEVADSMDLTRQRISQIQAAAIRKIKRGPYSKTLNEYLKD